MCDTAKSGCLTGDSRAFGVPGERTFYRVKVPKLPGNGVSTKYLNRYLAMFVALEQAGRSLFHPDVDAVRTMLAQVNTALPIRSLRKDGLLAI